MTIPFKHWVYYALFSAVFCSFCLSSQAQKRGFEQTYTKFWKTAVPDFEDKVEADFLGADAVILNEKTEWDIESAEGVTTVKRFLRIKFLTQEGIQQFSRISVPESVDPSDEYSNLPTWERTQKHRPKYADLKVEYFRARKYLRDGSQQVKSLVPRSKIEQEHWGFKPFKEKVFAYHFDLTNIQVGDVVEVEYAYYVPYYFNSKRFFFHDQLPKQKVEFTLTYPLYQVFIIGSELRGIGREYEEKINDEGKGEIKFQFQNLVACIDEANSRYYEHLPYFFYYIHDNIYGNYDESGSLIEHLPYSWYHHAYAKIGLKRNAPLTTLGNAPLRYWLKEGINRLPFPERLYAFQWEVNKELTYNTKPYLLTVGQNNFNRMISDEEIRAEKMHEFYEWVFTYWEKEFFSATTIDKRINRINTETFLPPFGANYLYVVDHHNQPLFVMPKNHQTGYEVNELPFYLEGVKSLLINQMIDHREADNSVVFTTSPKVNNYDNRRFTDLTLKANLEQQSMSVEGMTLLSGQYSTLIRRYFMHREMDSSVNVLYYALPAFDRQNPQQNLASEVVMADKRPPYETAVETKYATSLPIQKIDDKKYQISMQNWFPFVIHPNFEASERDLPYYADFQGMDTFVYTIEFEEEVKLNPYDNMPIIIENKWGSFTFHISQLSPNKVEVMARYTILSDVVSAYQAIDVEQIYHMIEKINQAMFVVEKL